MGAVCVCAPNILAQDYGNPGLGQEPVATYGADYSPMGIRAGGFTLHPGVQLAAEFNDNVFYTDEDGEFGTRSDTIYHIRPYLNVQSNWSRHSLNLSLGADIARYQDFSFRDYEDYYAVLAGNIDVRNDSYFSYSLSYMNLHEELNNRDSEQSLEPTRYDRYGGSLGYDHTFNRVSVGVGYAHHWLDYDDALSVNGDALITNQDRDHEASSWNFRAAYQFQTQKQLFVSYAINEVEYDQPFDDNGYARSSDGWSANIGMSFSITDLLDGDASYGYYEQSYDDPLLPDVSGWGGSAGLTWTPTLRTTVDARVSSSIQESTLEYASGYFRTLYSLRADHELRRNLQVSANVWYSNNDYELIAGAPPDARSDDSYWGAGLGLNYFINRHAFFSAAYTYETLDSSVPNDDYDVNRLWLTLTLER